MSYDAQRTDTDLRFCSPSGTGKTTLLTQLIPLLSQRGLRLGLIKHSHHDFEIDQPGKDSFRLRKAGAVSVMLSSSHRRAIITEITPPEEPSLDSELKYLDQSGLDLILVEGFKHETFAKIELHRQALNQDFLYPDDAGIIAVATDTPLQTPVTLAQLDINCPEMIADFIVNTFMRAQ